jgi:ABC-type antimicrobial peptide transport system permease subunit
MDSMRALVHLTLKDLIHDRWHSLLTIISLAFVVLAYLLLATLSRALFSAGKQTQITNNLVILASDAIDPMDSSLNEEVLQIARDIAPDQIQRAFPTLFRHMLIGGRILQVRAVPLDEMSSALALTLVQGSFPSGPRQIVIGEEIARDSSWKIGSTVNIYGTDFKVTGLVCASENNLATLWMTYIEGQKLFGMNRGFQVGYLPLVPSADPEIVRARLQADPRISVLYTIYLENTVSNGYSEVNHNLVTMSGIMAVVSLLAITFGIYNSTNLSLTERSHEICLLRLMGFTSAKLRGILFARALLLTFAAYGLGWAVLKVLSSYQDSHAPMGSSEAPLILSQSLTASLVGLALASAFAFLGVLLTSGRIMALNALTESD